MSNYPLTPSYGTNPSYLPPTYPNQYTRLDDGNASQGHVAGTYDASMNVYGYNRTVPAFSAAAVASGVPPLPIFTGWSTAPLPSYNVSQNGGQYNGYASQAPPQQYYPPAQPSYQPHPHQAKPFETELSEGEFEDNGATIRNSAVGYSTSQHRGNDGTGYVDTAQRALYSRTQDYTSQQSYPPNKYNYPSRDHSQTRRQQSDSYSPYASPSGPPNTERPSGTQNQNSYAPGPLHETPAAVATSQYSWPQKSAIPSQPKSDTNGHTTPRNGESKIGESTVQNPAVTSQPTLPPSANGSGNSHGKSVAESRKKAQAAILNLWPYDVRYSTYIDEGFKEEYIRPLFDELKLSRNSLHSGHGAEPNSKPEYKESQFFQSHHPYQADTSTFPSGNGNSRDAPAASNASQESIPSLSVTSSGNLVSAKGAVPQAATEPVRTSVTQAPPAKSVSMIEKDKALKSKMDALRKSREDRAQKAAAKNTPSSIVPSTVAAPNEPPKLTVGETTVPKEVSLDANSSLESPSISKGDLQLRVASPTATSNTRVISEPPTSTTQIQKQVPVIPGLFLASAVTNATSQQCSQGTLQSPIQSNQRKRPVAADFDEPVSSITPFKRPFGQSRNDKPLVIDVSDEEMDSESEDVAMDLESIADDSPAQPLGKMPDQRVPVVQTYPNSNNLNQPKPWSPPAFSSPVHTPPLLQQVSRGAFGRPEILLRKESEIEELKKKIAEAEAKKRAKQTPSGSRTPRAPEVVSVEGKPTPQSSSAVHSQADTSAQIQQLIEAADKKIADEQLRLARARAVEAAKVTEEPKLKNIVTEQKRMAAENKRMRRDKIASDLAALIATEEQELAMIEQKKAEVAEMEARRKRVLDDQQKMLEEMQLLGPEEEEEDNDDIEVQNDERSDHESPDTSRARDGSSSSNIDLPATSVSAVEESHHPISPSHAQPLASLLNTPQASSDNHHESIIQATAGPVIIGDNEGVCLNGTLDFNHDDEGPSPQSKEHVAEAKDGLSTDQALEAALQEAVRIEADSHAHTEDGMDVEVSSAPDPSQIAPNISSSPAHEDPSSLKSSDYSPELDRGMPDMPDRESDDYEPPEAQSLEAPSHEYKPPAGTLTANPPSTVDSPPFSPAPPTAMIEATDEMILDINSVQTQVEQAGERSKEDSLPTNGSIPNLVENPAEEPSHLALFTPYESPLKHFRAYRFHPQFKEEVPGGLKSMTYSHRINPGKELCRYELAGGICNDSTCDLQHFREIGLPDDAVLTALGSPDEFQGEQRDRFCVGLKEVLLKLRVNKVRDFDIIASEIIAHRVKFLGDKSKVLPLEGTTI